MPTVALLLVALTFVAPDLHAASVNVVLPPDAALHVVEARPPAGGPRIDCPPLCFYEVPGPSLDIMGGVDGGLRVTQELDPRTNNPPFDIIGMPGCAATSALPATIGTCHMPAAGSTTVGFMTRYRPILAVTVEGTVAGTLSNLFITGSPGPGYMGTGVAFPCNAVDPVTTQCARHFTVGQPMFIQAPSTTPNTLVEVSEPCAGELQVVENARRCDFTLLEDTCVSLRYVDMSPAPEQSISGPGCVTGPGVTPGDGGGGGGGGGTPPDLQGIKDVALELMRVEYERVVYPCLVALSGEALLAAGPLTQIVALTMVAAAAPLCATGVRQLIELKQIYDDPPDFDFHEIARIPRGAGVSLELPSCGELQGGDRRFCRRLGKGMRKYAGKAERVSNVAEALRTTVERWSAALLANEARAARRQERTADKRRRQLEKAIRKRNKAGARVARILAGAGVTGALTEAQFTEGTDAVLAHLAEGGVPDAEARMLLDPVLAPRELDVLEVLGR